MVIVSMKGAAYPVCGMLEQSEFDALAALKQENGKLILFTDRSIEEMMEGNLLNAAWDAFMVLDGKALCSADLLPMLFNADVKTALSRNVSELGRYWHMDKPEIELHVLDGRLFSRAAEQEDETQEQPSFSCVLQAA